MYPRKCFSLFYNSFAKLMMTYGLFAYGARAKTNLEPIENVQQSIRGTFLQKPSEPAQLFLEKNQMLTVYELHTKE